MATKVSMKLKAVHATHTAHVKLDNYYLTSSYMNRTMMRMNMNMMIEMMMMMRVREAITSLPGSDIPTESIITPDRFSLKVIF